MMTRRTMWCACWVLCAIAYLAPAPAVCSDPTPLAENIDAPPFQFRDIAGRSWDNQSAMGKHGLVVAFLGVECPLAATYTERLLKLHREWAKQGRMRC